MSNTLHCLYIFLYFYVIVFCLCIGYGSSLLSYNRRRVFKGRSKNGLERGMVVVRVFLLMIRLKLSTVRNEKKYQNSQFKIGVSDVES